MHKPIRGQANRPRLHLFQEVQAESPPPSKKPRRVPTFRRVWRKYLLPSLVERKRSKKTIDDIQLHLTRWEKYWKEGQRIIYPLAPSRVRRKHLEEWRRSLLASGISARTVNKHLASIRQLLICAEKHELVDRRARLEQLPHKKAASKLYLTDAQVDRLWETAEKLTWPRGKIDPPTFWRAALVLYRTYGFRTQELIAYEGGKVSIRWLNVLRDSAETPNPDGTAMNAFGWLWYVPQKQSWAKPDPLYVPLTRHARAAIDRLAARAGAENEKPLFEVAKSPRSFYDAWRKWLALAEVAPKAAPGRKASGYEPKHLRKTCATFLDRHHPGLADAVCGWGDRSGSDVASNHYIADELTIVDKLITAPMPGSFDAWL